MPNRGRGLLLATLLACTPPAWADEAALPNPIRFNQHIRPILAQHCFACHGPDDKKREADLRLDTRDSAIARRGGGAAIVPGQPDDSELLRRVTTADPDELMPPPDSKKPRLADARCGPVAGLDRRRRGLRSGTGRFCRWPTNRRRTSRIRPGSGIRSTTSSWHGWSAEGVRPAPEADRATLIRRVTLDLTGLLPTPEEVTAFRQDAHPQAYEQAGRPAAGLAALRGTLGPALAGPRPLRGFPRLHHRRRTRRSGRSGIG